MRADFLIFSKKNYKFAFQFLKRYDYEIYFKFSIFLEKNSTAYAYFIHCQREQRICVKEAYSTFLYVPTLTKAGCVYTTTWVSFVFVLLRKPTLCQTTTNVFEFLNRVGIIYFFKHRNKASI